MFEHNIPMQTNILNQEACFDVAVYLHKEHMQDTKEILGIKILMLS